MFVKLNVSKVFILLFVGMILSVMISTPVFAEPVNPNLNYYSNPSFEVDKFDIEEVVQNALQMDYTIMFSTSCLGISVGECIQNGWLNEWIVNENATEGKGLSVSTAILLNDTTGEIYNKTYTVLQVSINNIDFGASPKNHLGNLYLFTSGFRSDDPQMTTERASDIIVNELKALGILDANTNLTIQFSSYTPPTTYSIQNMIQKLPILHLAIIIIVILIVMARRSSG